MRERLVETLGAYEAALTTQALDPARVDLLEDDLVDLFEEAEAFLES